MKLLPQFCDAIRTEVRARLDKNPNYSLRAFAKQVGVDPGNLSRALAGKVGLSRKARERIAAALPISATERSIYVTGTAQPEGGSAKPLIEEIDQDVFHTIADIHHAAILELTYLEEFRADPRWIAAKLSISSIQASNALDRLIRLGLLKKVDGRWCRVSNNILKTRGGALTSKGLRRHQNQVLTGAQKALEETPVERRVQVSMTFPMAEKDIEMARELIENFAAKVCESFSRGPKDSVYQLGVSLYPLTASCDERREEKCDEKCDEKRRNSNRSPEGTVTHFKDGGL